MNKMYRLILGLSLLYIPASYADVKLNGFASIRASQANSDGGKAPFGEFKEGQISFKSESLFALQASADLTEGLSATVQLFADGADDFNLEARWAYISYQLSDNHQLNAGRLANPTFHQSEYEKVGYTHNFARLPKAVYARFDFATVEGISLNSQFDVGDGDYTLDTKLLYGSWDGEVALAAFGDIPLGLDDIMSFNATFSGDWWKVFGGAFITKMNASEFDMTTLLPAVQPGIQLAQSLGATSNDINLFTDSVIWNEKDGLYWFAGFGLDYSDWIIDFEYTAYGVKDSVDSENKNWFFAVGRRFNDFVMTIHTEKATQPTDYDFLNNVSHPVLTATGTALADNLSIQEHDGVGVTLRYDFHPSAALKVDYFSGNSTQSAIGDYQIMSIGIDLVF